MTSNSFLRKFVVNPKNSRYTSTRPWSGVPSREIQLPSFRTRFEQANSRHYRRLPLFVWTLVSVFGFMLLGASKAEATCGDYLAHHGMDQDSHFGMTDDGHPAGTIPLRAPCHGPSCQRGPVQIPLSTPVVSLEPQDRWGGIANVEVPMLDQTSFLTQFSEPVCLPMIAFRLDRPPKA